ncbi:MAG: c-type cytochrome biogenesis protein CcsB [Deltaproteobacteria bacterium]|nr:c-type cytochrome biogenesis protein CcsB [Deltaproteobacteria bacterium]
MEALTVKLTAAIYLLAAAGNFYVLFRKDAASRLPTLALLAGFLFHTGALTARFLNEGFGAVALMGEALLFKSWLMVGLYLSIQLKYRVSVLGGIVAPLAFLMCLAAYAFGRGDGAIPPGLESVWLPVHVTLAFLGNAVFALAFGVSLIYLLQERHLKHKKISALINLFPPLESLDRLNYLLLVWGFPLMTLGIVTGSLWAGIHWGNYWSWEPRQISSGIAWLFYGAILHGRITAGLRGKKAALLTMVGFFVVLGYFLLGDTMFPSRHGGQFQ